MTPAEQEAGVARYRAYTEDLHKAGIYVASDRLQPSATAMTVRTKGGKTVVMDGPFAESKEQVAGYFIIEVDSREAAAEWAARCPAAGHGAVEVRPIYAM